MPLETIGWTGPRRAALEAFMVVTQIRRDLDDAQRFIAAAGPGNAQLLADDIADAEVAILLAAQAVVDTRP